MNQIEKHKKRGFGRISRGLKTHLIATGNVNNGGSEEAAETQYRDGHQMLGKLCLLEYMLHETARDAVETFAESYDWHEHALKWMKEVEKKLIKMHGEILDLIQRGDSP